MLVGSLLAVILVAGTAASAEGPLAGRGSWALGAALPSASGLSLSLWNVRSPVTALGLETGFSSYSSDNRRHHLPVDTMKDGQDVEWPPHPGDSAQIRRPCR